MNRPIRFLLAALSTGAAFATAGAQPPQDSSRVAERPRAERTRTDPTPTAARVRMHPRDLVGADSNVCDDLCRRERMMDSLYGKDRERRPAMAQRRPMRRP